MKTGIALIVDDAFRVTEKCETCQQRIGPYDFMVKFELQPKPGITSYEHVACAQKAEAIFQQQKDLERRGKS
jgi:hypothetical protein